MQQPENNDSRSNYSMSQILIVIGLLIVAVGFLWPYLQKLNLFHLPGDIVVKKENFSFYFPITTSILISIFLSLIFWLMSKMK